MSDIATFYAHLDVCERCRNHPFDLCADGERLVVAATSGIIDAIQRRPPNAIQSSAPNESAPEGTAP